MFKRIEGVFFRAVLSDRVKYVLSPPSSESAGRYHRLGEATLYMSPVAEWATIAVSGYIREDGRSRVVVPMKVTEAFVLDLSNKPWRSALAAGTEPPSWKNADAARKAGADGIVDRSRMIPNGWHVNLFRWNDLGGPTLSVCGDPISIGLSKDGPKWGL